MSEYIFEWSDIGSDVTEIVQSDTSPWKVTKVTRHARLREPIVRCRDCRYYTHNTFPRCDLYSVSHEVEPDGFCAWAIRRTE